jgi:hypothetical protein
MGEFSKRLGDIGEKVIIDFLKSIGWFDPQRNIDIVSIDEEHRKNSNGLDGLFHYVNPMISNSVVVVHYSSKYSKNPYPSSLVKDFKGHYTDLVKTIESYKKSEQNQELQTNSDNVDTFFYRGILFWLNNAESENDDLISRLNKIELNTGVVHDGVFLVDNKRILFIYDAINYMKINFPVGDYKVEFIYFLSGLNAGDGNLRSGSILPIEYINGSILPIIARKGNETTVVLFSIDSFSKDDLLKLFGIANTIGNNTQGSTLLCFYDYKESEHLPLVENAKQSFGNSDFTRNLKVDRFPYGLLK